LERVINKLIDNSGEGLGKNKTGMTEIIQVRKREENLGVIK
jgi:hypothetical protein